MKTLAQLLEERGMTAAQLAAASGLDGKLVNYVVGGNFTPGPVHRKQLAAALGVSTGDICWEHSVTVQHLRGNGPQAGRST